MKDFFKQKKLYVNVKTKSLDAKASIGKCNMKMKTKAYPRKFGKR